MRMSLRSGETFSPETEGTIEFEIGAYAIGWNELDQGTIPEDVLRLDGIGEYVVTEEVRNAVAGMRGATNFTKAELGKAILGKMLELGATKVWIPS